MYISLLFRSLQCIVQDSNTTAAGLLLNRDLKVSPIAKLAQIEPASGKTSAIHGLICVRPSELFFVLQSMELSNISAAPLSAYSKELSQAILHMHTSDLLQRLHTELHFAHPNASTAAAAAGNNTSASSSSSSSSSSTAGFDLGMGSSGGGVGILESMKELGVAMLDREVTFLLHIAPHCTYHNEFMHFFNDDTSVAPAAALLPPVKGLPGGANAYASSAMNYAAAAAAATAAADADLTSLLTSESVEESQEAHSLASIRWIVAAARSALKAMYEHNSSSISKNQSTVRELQELRGKLLARQNDIADILADWKKLSVCVELCSNFKAQISLLLEKYKYHKKLALQSDKAGLTWNSSGVSAGGAVQTEGAATSTVALLEASDSITAAGAAKDAEVQSAVSKIVLLQLKLEAELQQFAFHYDTSSGMGGIVPMRGSEYTAPHSASRSGSKLAALANASPAGSRYNGRAGAEEAKSGVRVSSELFSENMSGSVGSGRRRAPNPLHVVMQSVFASSSQRK